jgi:hypothetical protein
VLAITASLVMLEWSVAEYRKDRTGKDILLLNPFRDKFIPLSRLSTACANEKVFDKYACFRAEVEDFLNEHSMGMYSLMYLMGIGQQVLIEEKELDTSSVAMGADDFKNREILDQIDWHVYCLDKISRAKIMSFREYWNKKRTCSSLADLIKRELKLAVEILGVKQDQVSHDRYLALKTAIEKFE